MFDFVMLFLLLPLKLEKDGYFLSLPLMDFTGALPLNWWEDNHGGAEQEESDTNRDIAAATVLAEYVTAVSRPQEWVRRGGTDSPRQVDAEQGREGSLTRTRRVSARSAPPIAEATLNNSIGMNDTVGIYLSACGHAVHQDCRDRYFSSLLQRLVFILLEFVKFETYFYFNSICSTIYDVQAPNCVQL
jgi:hypothetical protein